jgi:hypothetical protein
MERVDVVIVDVVVLPTSVVEVTLVWMVDEIMRVARVISVVVAKLTSKVTGKFGMANVQTYPGWEPHDTPLVS